MDWGDPGDPFPYYVALIRGDRYRIGNLDKEGNFVPDAEHYTSSPVYGPGIWWPRRYFLGWGGGLYEHRAGGLIAGVIEPTSKDSPDYRFVPKVGSRITALKDFRRPPHQPYIIWNLPDFKTIEADTRQARADAKAGRPAAKFVPLPRVDPPGPTGVPAGYEYVPFSKFARFDPPPWVAHVWHERMELGHLNDFGDFVPEYGLPPFPLTKPARRVHDAFTYQPAPWYYNLPVDRADLEHVYEYRSGRLVKGVLKRNGTFVPELDSRVLDFKDYVPGEQALRIYNLPGRLKKKPAAPPAPEPDTSKKPPRRAPG
jgi:hypothetical protein